MPIDVSKLNLSFKPVTTTVPVVGGAPRDDAGGTMWPSGRLPLNIRGSEEWNGICHKSGLDFSQIGAACAADEANKVVKVHPVAGLGDSIMPVRWSPDKAVATLHLGGVFKALPKLKVRSKRDVAVAAVTEADGTSWLYILLQIALAKPKSRTAANTAVVDDTLDNIEEEPSEE